jgi:hypothetical protein
MFLVQMLASPYERIVPSTVTKISHPSDLSDLVVSVHGRTTFGEDMNINPNDLQEVGLLMPGLRIRRSIRVWQSGKLAGWAPYPRSS